MQYAGATSSALCGGTSERTTMPIYRLQDLIPDLPPKDRYYVAPGAHVIGRVRLGEDASVWFNTIIRGDTELINIGPRVNIQDNCVLHTDPGFPVAIGADATIGTAHFAAPIKPDIDSGLLRATPIHGMHLTRFTARASDRPASRATTVLMDTMTDVVRTLVDRGLWPHARLRLLPRD
jgi:hypothetical protein